MRVTTARIRSRLFRPIAVQVFRDDEQIFVDDVVKLRWRGDRLHLWLLDGGFKYDPPPAVTEYVFHRPDEVRVER